MEDTNDNDQILLNGSRCFLREIFGEENWIRWNDVMYRSGMDNIQTFLAWILNIADNELCSNNGEMLSAESAARPPSVGAKRRRIASSSAYRVSAAAPSTHVNDVYDGYNSETVAPPGGDGTIDNNQSLCESAEDALQPSTSFHVAVDQHVMSSYLQHTSDIPTALDPSAAAHIKAEALGCSVEDVGEVAAVGQDVCCRILAADFDQRGSGVSFYCQLCGIYLHPVEMLQNHVGKAHAGLPVTVECSMCAQAFTAGIGSFVQHMPFCWGDKDCHKCKYCGKALKSKPALRQHIANQHEMSAPQFPCKLCDKRFKYASQLSRHKTEYHPQLQQPSM